MLYTLVTEGSDDRVLHQPIDWLLQQHCTGEFAGQWANPAAMDDSARDLGIRLRQAHKYFPADLYLVHRDTDTFTYDDRKAEIEAALDGMDCNGRVVCVIPVRMTEAWLLFDEASIRRAADNVRGRAALTLPTPSEAQRRADPKALLEEKLVIASELSGRRLAQFRSEMSRRKSLVAQHIDDFSALRRHESFNALEGDLQRVIRDNGW